MADDSDTGSTEPSGERQPARTRTVLTDISSRAWEHPADKGALVALRKLKGFDTLLKAMSGLINERSVRLLLLGSAVRADERNFVRLHRLLTDVGSVLDAADLPELYVRASPMFNAYTIGLNTPIIVVDSGLVALLDDDEEMRFLLGHELGHALSGHAVYQTLLRRLLGLTGVLYAVPGGALGVRAITAALMEWSRKAELSADRAGLLAAQNPAAANRVHMKLASGGDLDDLDATSFFAQGSEYTETEDLRDSVLKLFLVETQSHPFAVVRSASCAGGPSRGSTPRSSAAPTRAARPTPPPRSATPRRRPPPATARPSSAPRTPWAAWCTTLPASSDRPGSGSTRGSVSRRPPVRPSSLEPAGLLEEHPQPPQSPASMSMTANG